MDTLKNCVTLALLPRRLYIKFIMYNLKISINVLSMLVISFIVITSYIQSKRHESLLDDITTASEASAVIA